MAGELWRGTVQIGKETTPGTGVVATRRLYTMEPSISIGTTARFHDFATASRGMTRAVTPGFEAPGGSLRIPMSSSELIEFFLMGLKGGVTPTTPGGATNTRLWTFVPDATALDAATIEWMDGSRTSDIYGVHVDSLTFTGNAQADNMVAATLFGRSLAYGTSLTGSLAERVPDFIEGWQTKLYIDAFGGTPGSTAVPGTMINWEVRIANGLIRKYYANNTQNAGAITISPFAISATFLFEAEGGTQTAEINNLRTAAKRLIRLEFQDETGFIEGAFRRFVTVDIPGAWETNDLGQTDQNTRAYRFTYRYIFDPTNAFPIQVRAQNARTAAYA